MEYTKEEKHTPIVEINWNKVKITVPSHPAQADDHFISNISVFDWKWWKLLVSKDLSPENAPVLEFEAENTENLYITEKCSTHWEWDSEWKFLKM